MREKISRSQKKRAAEALQATGKALVGLSAGQLQSLDIPAVLKTAIESAQKMNRQQEAYRRQIQYIGRLMRELDTERIEAALGALVMGQEREKRRFARIERWRDALVSGDDELLAWIGANVAGVDHRKLGELVESARGKGPPGLQKAASRELFRYLMSA